MKSRERITFSITLNIIRRNIHNHHINNFFCEREFCLFPPRGRLFRLTPILTPIWDFRDCTETSVEKIRGSLATEWENLDMGILKLYFRALGEERGEFSSAPFREESLCPSLPKPLFLKCTVLRNTASIIIRVNVATKIIRAHLFHSYTAKWFMTYFCLDRDGDVFIVKRKAPLLPFGGPCIRLAFTEQKILWTNWYWISNVYFSVCRSINIIQVHYKKQFQLIIVSIFVLNMAHWGKGVGGLRTTKSRFYILRKC